MMDLCKSYLAKTRELNKDGTKVHTKNEIKGRKRFEYVTPATGMTSRSQKIANK